MIDTVEAITINYEDNGILVVKELEKVVLSKKAAWVTVLFRYQDWVEKNEEYSSEKYAIRRYQKRNGEYRVQAKFSLTSKEQAQELVTALSAWLENSADEE